jgi:hypothetical protein
MNNEQLFERAILVCAPQNVVFLNAHTNLPLHPAADLSVLKAVLLSEMDATLATIELSA